MEGEGGRCITTGGERASSASAEEDGDEAAELVGGDAESGPSEAGVRGEGRPSEALGEDGGVGGLGVGPAETGVRGRLGPGEVGGEACIAGGGFPCIAGWGSWGAWCWVAVRSSRKSSDAAV